MPSKEVKLEIIHSEALTCAPWAFLAVVLETDLQPFVGMTFRRRAYF